MKNKVNISDLIVSEISDVATSMTYPELKRTNVGMSTAKNAFERWKGFGYIDENDKFNDSTASHAVMLDNLLKLMVKTGRFYQLNASIGGNDTSLMEILSDLMPAVLEKHTEVTLSEFLNAIRNVNGIKMVCATEANDADTVKEYLTEYLNDYFKNKEDKNNE